MRRLLAAALIVAAPFALCAQALAGTQSLVVPSIAADPPLDPSAAAGGWAGAAPLALHWDVVHSHAPPEPIVPTPLSG